MRYDLLRSTRKTKTVAFTCLKSKIVIHGEIEGILNFTHIGCGVLLMLSNDIRNKINMYQLIRSTLKQKGRKGTSAILVVVV